MADYKQQAALAAIGLIKENQVIGLGAGRTIAYVVAGISENSSLAQTLTFVSPSPATLELMLAAGLKIKPVEACERIDLYFDGCDQVDLQLNALKSGAGIHAYEKILAAMADKFILLGDSDKLIANLNTQYPFTIEIIPDALASIKAILQSAFEIAGIHIRVDASGTPIRTKHLNYLLDVHFTLLPALDVLNTVKLLPGVVDHSLFHGVAAGAIICGEDGIRHLVAEEKRARFLSL